MTATDQIFYVQCSFRHSSTTEFEILSTAVIAHFQNDRYQKNKPFLWVYFNEPKWNVRRIMMFFINVQY